MNLEPLPQLLKIKVASILPTWGAIDDHENGLLRLTPWSVEVNEFRGTPQPTT